MYWFCILLLANPFKFNILRMVLESGLFAQVVLLILVFFSIFSWAIIIHKSRVFKRVDSHTRKFLKTFRKRKRLSEIYLACMGYDRTPLSRMLEVGYKELEEVFKEEVRSNKGINIDNERLDDIKATMDRIGSEELEKLAGRVNQPLFGTSGNRMGGNGLLCQYRGAGLCQPGCCGPGNSSGPDRYHLWTDRGHTRGHRLQPFRQ